MTEYRTTIAGLIRTLQKIADGKGVLGPDSEVRIHCPDAGDAALKIRGMQPGSTSKNGGIVKNEMRMLIIETEPAQRRGER